MRRPRPVVALALTLVALALMLSACGGGDDEEAATSPGETPSGDVAPPTPGALPPQLVQCYAKRGYKVQSPTDIHSAPPDVVQECFGALHQGGGGP